MVDYPDQELIPYGASRLHPDAITAISVSGEKVALRCTIPHAIVTPKERKALRLNDGCYDFSGQAAPIDGPGAPDSLDLLRSRIENLCDLWARPARAFVSQYFEWIASQVERHRIELERLLEPFGGLYGYRDWIYSAPAPLPWAWLHAPGRRGDSPCAETFVPVDFAFWVGGGAVAVFVTGSESSTARSRERMGRLRDAGVMMVDIPGELVRSRPEGYLGDRLPAQFMRFWEGEKFPSGPFRNSMLEQTNAPQQR